MTDHPTPAGGLSAEKISRRRWCRCSRADRMNDRAQPSCPLHGSDDAALAYQDGLTDGGAVRDAEHADRLAEVKVEAHNAEADYDRRGERLWRLAALAGHEPWSEDNDATAEQSITAALTEHAEAHAALDRVRAENHALRDAAPEERLLEAIFGTAGCRCGCGAPRWDEDKTVRLLEANTPDRCGRCGEPRADRLDPGGTP